jgi:predicted PhzF superfamily epimerase YddE/YHI9
MRPKLPNRTRSRCTHAKLYSAYAPSKRQVEVLLLDLPTRVLQVQFRSIGSSKVLHLLKNEEAFLKMQPQALLFETLKHKAQVLKVIFNGRHRRRRSKM